MAAPENLGSILNFINAAVPPGISRNDSLRASRLELRVPLSVLFAAWFAISNKLLSDVNLLSKVLWKYSVCISFSSSVGSPASSAI